MASQSLLIRSVAALLAAASLSCVGLSGPSAQPAPRISELLEEGDPRHRASQRLVLEGLDADAQGDMERARSRYARALQIDASNPWAYLALARHLLDAGEVDAALAHLEQAEIFFESDAEHSPRAEVHCIGLRGEALALTGSHREAQALLDEAARRAPAVWGDGHLTAAELR